MSRTYIWAYNPASQGAKALARELGIRRIRHEGSNFRPFGKVLINWGSYALPFGSGFRDVKNLPAMVSECRDKLRTFRMLSGHARIPRCTSDPTEALSWKTAVVERHLLTSSQGRGIIIKDFGELLAPAPLYVEYVKKSAEYRIHCMKIHQQIEVIDVQRKIRNPSREPTDWRVRSHSNGFIFIRMGFTIPEDCVEQAKRAMASSGLDFGAVDVIWNDKSQQGYVLEINTAPGLEGQTVVKYAEGFRRMLS